MREQRQADSLAGWGGGGGRKRVGGVIEYSEGDGDEVQCELSGIGETYHDGEQGGFTVWKDGRATAVWKPWGAQASPVTEEFVHGYPKGGHTTLVVVRESNSERDGYKRDAMGFWRKK